MLALSSTGEVVERLAHAETVSAEAYTLGAPLVRALAAAARGGALVSVALEAHPYEDRNGSLGRLNARIVQRLRAAGVDACLRDGLHAKEIAVDGTLYLDEKNWRDNDIVVRLDGGRDKRAVATSKSGALAQEGRLLAGAAPGEDVIVATESLGAGNATYAALADLAKRGLKPRLLVTRRVLRETPRERALLAHLERDGVRVRSCDDSAKLAAVGDRAWLGSANATYAGGRWDMSDWGLDSADPAVASAVRQRLEDDWASAKPVEVLDKQRSSAEND